jgi:hypothetical protein
MRQRRNIDVAALFGLLSVDIVETLNRASNFADAKQRFEGAKAEAHGNLKRAAFELHPDRNPEGEDRLKELTEAWNMIKQLEIQPPRPRPAVRVYVSGFGNFANTGTSTSYTTTNTW